VPATWTAQKSHRLMPPERRSLFRVITRRRDRALCLVRTVRRDASTFRLVTLVVLTACLVAALAGH
jgi:hypothetical protein